MFYISYVSSFIEVLAKLHVVEKDGYIVEDEGETGAGAVGGAVASRHQAYRKTTQAKPTATVTGVPRGVPQIPPLPRFGRGYGIRQQQRNDD